MITYCHVDSPFKLIRVFDRSGTVSLDELRRALAQTETVDVDKIFEGISLHHNSEINYNEFLAAAMCKRVEIDEDKLIAVRSSNNS
jgi:Ca2+-binding EF-hand superfamily protein